MSLRGHKIIPLVYFDCFLFTYVRHESMNMLVSAQRWRQFVLQKSVCVWVLCFTTEAELWSYQAAEKPTSSALCSATFSHSMFSLIICWCIEDANALVVSTKYFQSINWWLHDSFSKYKQMISKMYEEMVARSMIVRSLCGVLLVTNSCDLSQAIKRRKWGSVSRDASPSMTPSCYSLCDLLKFFDSGWNAPSTCPKVQTAPCDIWKHFPVSCIMCAQ